MQRNPVSFMTIAAIILITSMFSFKGLGGTMGALKVEESAVINKSNSYRSAAHKSEENVRQKKRVDFVICNECFWCASQIKEKDILTACPGCKGSSVKSIPVYDLGERENPYGL